MPMSQNRDQRQSANSLITSYERRRRDFDDIEQGHDTNDEMSETMPAYVIEGMVGTRRLELLTSTVSIELEVVTDRKQKARMAPEMPFRTLGNRYWTPIGPQFLEGQSSDITNDKLSCRVLQGAGHRSTSELEGGDLQGLQQTDVSRSLSVSANRRILEQSENHFGDAHAACSTTFSAREESSTFSKRKWSPEFERCFGGRGRRANLP
jgi:hypothetical protein